MTLQNRKALLSAAVFSCCFAIPDAILAQTVKLHISSKAGDRLAAKPDLLFSDSQLSSGATFEINDAVKFQKIDGFGASIMEAGILTLNTLPADKQEEVLRALFDPQVGAGYTAMKTPVAGTDFQSAGRGTPTTTRPGTSSSRIFPCNAILAPTVLALTSCAPANMATSRCRRRWTTRRTGCSSM